MKRKLKITITKIQAIRVFEQNLQKPEFCPICQGFVETIRCDETKFESWLKVNKQVHQITDRNGNLWLCKNSL